MKKRKIHFVPDTIVWNHWRLLAEDCNLSMSAYAGTLIAGSRPRKALPPGSRNVVRELRAIRNNLEQIAVVANMFGLEGADSMHNISREFAARSDAVIRSIRRKWEVPGGDRKNLAG